MNCQRLLRKVRLVLSVVLLEGCRSEIGVPERKLKQASQVEHRGRNLPETLRLCLGPNLKKGTWDRQVAPLEVAFCSPVCRSPT